MRPRSLNGRADNPEKLPTAFLELGIDGIPFIVRIQYDRDLTDYSATKLDDHCGTAARRGGRGH